MIPSLSSVAQRAESRMGPIIRRFGSSRLEIGSQSRVWVHRLRQMPGTSIVIGEESLISARIACERAEARVSIGDGTFIGGSLLSAAREIEVGSGVLISSGCVLMDHDSHSLSWQLRKDDARSWAVGEKSWYDVNISRLVIEDYAWIGINAVLLRGVTIGRGAVVAAGSVVTKSVAPCTLVAGNPARQIREL
jgi:acetyltransferase-like isoleucine patch superfamily enzyme